MKFLRFLNNSKNRKLVIFILFIVIAVCSLPNMGVGFNYNHTDLFSSGSIFNSGYALYKPAQRSIGLFFKSINITNINFANLSQTSINNLWQGIGYGIVGIIVLVPVVLSLVSLKSKTEKKNINLISIGFSVLYFFLIIYGTNDFFKNIKRSISLAGGHPSGAHIYYLPMFYISLAALVIVIIATIIQIKGIQFEDVEKSSIQPNNQNQIDVVSELTRYKDLLDKGIITQEEFESKKKELLNDTKPV